MNIETLSARTRHHTLLPILTLPLWLSLRPTFVLGERLVPYFFLSDIEYIFEIRLHLLKIFSELD
jgi:hypothetical protein